MEVQKTASCSIETLAPSISTSPSVSFAPSDITRRPTTNKPTTGKPTEEKCGVTCPVAFTGNHPTTNCTGFFYCDSGRMVGKITPCPRGTIYDEIKSVCGWPFETTCSCGITRKSYAPSSKPTTKMPTSKPTTRPPRTSKPNGDSDDYFDDDTVEKNLWYPNWSIQTCVDDGKQPTWMTESSLFESQATCCESMFSWNTNCLPPAPGPAPGKDDVIIL